MSAFGFGDIHLQHFISMTEIAHVSGELKYIIRQNSKLLEELNRVSTCKCNCILIQLL